MLAARLRDCSFATQRLVVDEWRRNQESIAERAGWIQELLRPAVTTSLPSAWSGGYTTERAAAWVRAREAESEVLAIRMKAESTPIGLVILHFIESDRECPDIHLGYFLAESTWGKGLATELLIGLIAWLRESNACNELHAGVDRSNLGSIRVLEKCGFQRANSHSAKAADSQTFLLSLS